MASLARAFGLPFRDALLLQRFAPPYCVRSLLEAAPEFGFRATKFRNRDTLGSARLPCIGFLKARESENGSDLARPALVLKRDGERILYFEACDGTPRTAGLRDARNLFEDTVLLFARDAEAQAPSAVELGQPSFGFAWFLREFAKHKGIWGQVLVASLALQVVGLAVPVLTQVVIDKVILHQAMSTLLVIAVALVAIMLFSAGLTWTRQYLILHTGNRVDAVLGSHVFRHLLRLGLPYFEHRPTGTLIARIHAVETVREFIAGAAIALLLDFPFLVLFAAVMFWYSVELTLIVLGILAVIAMTSAIVVPAFRRRLNTQFLLAARNQAFLTEYVSGMETVKSLQMEPRLERRYDDYLARYLDAGFSTRQLSNTYNSFAGALEQTMMLAVLCVGALFVMRGDGFTIGMLVAFQMFASRLSQPMLRLAALWQEFQQANIAVKRLGDIMAAPAEPYSVQPSRFGEARGELQICDLSFRYSADHPYLYEGLNLSLRPGRLTVLTGPSGSGKSTLAKLLLGFYQPADGRILLDGCDIRHLSANELRQNYGVVPQETFLFSGTIYENLLAANPHASPEEVVRACESAEIHEFIESLPQGYRSELGEHGIGLSGGQKQRIAIARALLKSPKILIFDEATSGLDAQAAEHFARTVNQLKGRVTILFIAHGLPRGLQVDEVVSLGATTRQMALM